MKSYEFMSNIIDRDSESDEIKNDLQNTFCNKVRIIYANSAIGKSTLSKKILEKCKNENRHIISVKTNPENTTTNASDWIYIDRIFEAFNQYFESDTSHKEFSFNEYIANTKDKALKKQIYQNIIDKIFECKNKKDFILVFLYYHVMKLLKLKEFDSQNIKDETTYNSRMIKARYIQYIFTNINMILVIDNLQNFDNISWGFFLNWLNMTKNNNHYIILEYTLSSKHTFENMFQLMEQIRETGTQVVYSELEELSPEHVIDVVEHHFQNKPQDLDFNINLLKHYKFEAKGNLRQLIDYTIGYTPEKKDCPSPTFNNLFEINSTSKYIFAILINCNGEISLKLLQELLRQMNISLDSMNVAFNELKSKEMIDIIDPKVVIMHASLIDVWKNNCTLFYEFNSLAFAKLESYFFNILHSDAKETERDYAWLILLQLYATYDPYKIQTLLSEISEKIIKQLSPVNTWKYLSLLINETKENIGSLESIYFQILQICFEIELYNEGYSCLCLMEKSINIFTNTKLLLFKSMYLSALDRHHENIILYEKFLPLLEINSRAYFNLNLIVLCSFRSLNDCSKCLAIHDELFKKRKFMNTYEYSIFMRLTNIYLPDNKAAIYARKSILTFHKLGNNVQEAKSMITYAKLLSGLGYGRKANKLILKAEQLLSDKYIGRHMIYSNQAAFLLMQGKSGDNIWFLLNQAESSAIVPYDKLGIVVNKLVWCYENRRYDLLDLLIAKTNHLIPLEPDEHIHVLIYYNLYLIYQQKGEHVLASKYYDMAYNNRDKCKYIKARFENINSKEMKHRLKFPWHICYLSFWTYDLDFNNFSSSFASD
jgi:hypothetical protein